MFTIRLFFERCISYFSKYIFCVRRYCHLAVAQLRARWNTKLLLVRLRVPAVQPPVLLKALQLFELNIRSRPNWNIK